LEDSISIRSDLLRFSAMLCVSKGRYKINVDQLARGSGRVRSGRLGKEGQGVHR
jgi:hypothetical protein